MTEPIDRAIADALQQGRAAEAERLSQLALSQSPDDENVLFMLALSIQQQGRHDEAARRYGELAERMPQSALHWGNYSVALRLAGRPHEAGEAALKAVALAPNDATQRVNLGLAQWQQDDYSAAQDSLLAACSLDPGSAVARINAASVQAAMRDAHANSLLRPWRSWLPLNDSALELQLAHLLARGGDESGAHALLVDLIRREPGNLEAMLKLAAHYERMNQVDAAEQVLADVTARVGATNTDASREAQHIEATLTRRRGDFAQARILLETCGARGEGDFTHFFELAEVCDKLGDTAAAMTALATAHTMQVRELSTIVPSRFAADAPILPHANARISRQAYAAWPKLLAPTAEQSPIFIVGFTRSGTTLLEQMLDAHPALQSMDEQPFLNMLSGELDQHGLNVPEDLGRLSQRDCDGLRGRYLELVCERIQRQWKTRLVDKNPLNMLWLPLLDRVFPRAKIVFVLRHPCDVVLSNYMQNYNSAILANACSTLQKTARAYVAAMENWIHHVEVFKPDLFVSRYEDLVADFPTQIERIAAFLHLDDASPMRKFDDHARAKGYIATPSYTQVIQPINKKGVGRWRRYREEFEPILAILKPLIEHWGYSEDMP